ncbi:helix-turn-helix domain-containing protein [Saccharothrix stipae]
MSIEAIGWALNDAPIPRDRGDAASLAAVLIGLANHADPNGRHAFPSIEKLIHYTRLSERTVRSALRSLQALNLICPSDPAVIAAHIKRADRRPNGYDLALRPFTEPEDTHHHGLRALPPVDQHEGQITRLRPARNGFTRGSTRPRTVLNPPENRPSREPAPEARSPRPPCGECDARDSDPISARVIWLDEDRTRSVLCARCHPRAIGAGEAAQ